MWTIRNALLILVLWAPFVGAAEYLDAHQDERGWWFIFKTEFATLHCPVAPPPGYKENAMIICEDRVNTQLLLCRVISQYEGFLADCVPVIGSET